MLNGGSEFFPLGQRRLDNPAVPDDKRNAALIAQVLATAKIDAYSPGPSDLKYGKAYFLQLAKDAKLPLISSNLVVSEKGKAIFSTSMRFQRGGVSVLVLALQDPKTWPQDSGLTAQEPVAAAQAILKKDAKPGELVFLIANANMERALRWAEALPELSGVLVAQRGMMSFFPRELKRAHDKGLSDGSALPLMAAGHSGGQLIQLDIHYQPNDTVLRGGAVFEDAREQLKKAQQILARNPQDPDASKQRDQAKAILDRQRGKTHYGYHFVEMKPTLPQDPKAEALVQQAKRGAVQ